MKKKRSEGFFGLHFDFHANVDCKDIGKNTTKEMIEEIIDRIKPDFMQCDSKGHPGYSSYLTNIGVPAPSIEKDALKIWREVCEEKEVSLYVHHSGVVDTLAVKEHPEWASIKYDKTLNTAFDNPAMMCTSLLGDYVDKRLIPQLTELYKNYGIDGAWVDGECWGVQPDYSEKALKEYKKETGKDAPLPDENGNIPIEYINFTRRNFFKYLNHYVDQIHKECPQMEIASNWAFSTYTPEKVCANVDFLSGDLPPANSVTGARNEARYLSKQRKPWDLMAWSFDNSGRGVSIPKSYIALCQELSVALAQGGGVQIYYTQEKDGSLNLSKLKDTDKIAKFCRERQEHCHRWEGIPQIAVLLSTDGCYHAEQIPFVFYDEVQNECRGIMECAIDSGFVVDFVSEHHLKENIDEYASIIVPEWEVIGNKDELLKYAENGGGLIIIGKNPAKIFEKELGVEIGDKKVSDKISLRDNGNFFELPESELFEIRSTSSNTYLEVSPSSLLSAPKAVGGTIKDYGKGKILGIYFDFGAYYLKNQSPLLRKLLKDAVNMVTDKILLNVTGSENIELTLTKKGNKTAINIINTSGVHDNPNTAILNEIPEIQHLDIELKANKAPKSVIRMPQGEKLDFVYENGAIKTSIDNLKIYDIIVIE